MVEVDVEGEVGVEIEVEAEVVVEVERKVGVEAEMEVKVEVEVKVVVEGKGTVEGKVAAGRCWERRRRRSWEVRARAARRKGKQRAGGAAGRESEGGGRVGPEARSRKRSRLAFEQPFRSSRGGLFRGGGGG